MELRELVNLIEQERALSARIDAELAKWSKPNRHGMTAMRLALGFLRKGVRKASRELGFSSSYVSRACSGKLITSREFMVKLHETYGLGSSEGRVK